MPVVRLSGAIGQAMALRTGLSIASVAPVLERAVSLPGAKALAIMVNSPGGSPVQSHLIFRRIRALAAEKSLPVFVFVEDAAASGGYMLACAGDEIFVDPSSIVGSIGVVSAGFGFTGLIERFGIERRIYTAGTSKAMLDPFRPVNPDDVARLKEIQLQIHDMFINLVRERRDARLKGHPDHLFSGAFWAGSDAVALGLADGIGDLRSVMRQRFGEKVRLQLIQPPRPSLLARLFGGRIPQISGLVDPDAAIAALEERALWSRIGL